MEIAVSLIGLDTTCNVEAFDSLSPCFYCLLSISHSHWPGSDTAFICTCTRACCGHCTMTLLCQHKWDRERLWLTAGTGGCVSGGLVLMFPLSPRGNSKPRGARRVTTSSPCTDDPITHSHLFPSSFSLHPLPPPPIGPFSPAHSLLNPMAALGQALSHWSRGRWFTKNSPPSLHPSLSALSTSLHPSLSALSTSLPLLSFDLPLPSLTSAQIPGKELSREREREKELFGLLALPHWCQTIYFLALSSVSERDVALWKGEGAVCV